MTDKSLPLDSAVEQVDEGRYRAEVSEKWKIWGPNGGYMAAIALRAAGAHTSYPRPVSFAGHFLKYAKFTTVDIATETLVSTRRAESVRVSITQGERPIFEGLLWSTQGDGAAMRADWAAAPEAPPPDDLATLDELMARDGFEAQPFWDHIEVRPITWIDRSTHPAGGEARLLGWMRFSDKPEAYTDPWLNAARAVVIADNEQFSAVTNALALHELTFVAPNMDIHVAFHAPDADDEWLLVEAVGLGAGDGLLGGAVKIWSPAGRLVATGGSQMLVTPFG